jgi:hypothetical protein
VPDDARILDQRGFHLVRLAYQAVTKVRQRVTRQALGRRGTTRDPAWANRRRLLRARERLTAEQFHRMREEILTQEATGELLAAWIAKEELRFLLSLARARPPRSEISNRLFAFYDWCGPRRRPRGHPARPHHRGLVAADPGLHRHRHQQRKNRSNQQDDQRRRPHRIRLPQPVQPAPPNTVALQADDHQSAGAMVTRPLNFEKPNS